MGKLSANDGYSYLSMIAIIAVLAVSAQIAYVPAAHSSGKLKEKILIHRAQTYISAIESYYYLIPDNPELPKRIEQLLVDDRIKNMRHLRDHVTEPFEQKTYEPIYNANGFLIGVYPNLGREPMTKNPQFIPNVSSINTKSYDGWEFTIDCEKINCKGDHG